MVRLLGASRRWARQNAEARKAGCRCGKPGTQVRSFGATGGTFDVVTCDEHVNVNGWRRRSDGTWVPTDSFDERALAYQVSQEEIR